MRGLSSKINGSRHVETSNDSNKTNISQLNQIKLKWAKMAFAFLGTIEASHLYLVDTLILAL